jgi:hypothetical protein
MAAPPDAAPIDAAEADIAAPADMAVVDAEAIVDLAESDIAEERDANPFRLDAGTTPIASGCGCVISRRPAHGAAPLLVLAIAFVLRRRSRRH